MSALAGKVALITGGGQGVGLGIAQAFAGAGASLVLTGRHLEKLQEVKPELEARGAKVALCAGDVRSRADADKAVALALEQFGRLDVLVNNAQSSVPGLPFEASGDAEIEMTVESGLYGTIYFMQAALPTMKDRGGSIINMGSRQGEYGAPGYTIYAATKEGIRGLSRATARELGPLGIRVNVICPSAATPAAKKFFADFPEEAAKNLQEVSLRRWGDSEKDIGSVAVFLASDASAFVTGQTINVDGGLFML